MVPSLHLWPSRHFVIPTEGRNLLVADTVALQATADSSTAAPFRNDKKVEIFGVCGGRGHNRGPQSSLVMVPSSSVAISAFCHSDRREESARGRHRDAASDSGFLYGCAVSE